MRRLPAVRNATALPKIYRFPRQRNSKRLMGNYSRRDLYFDIAKVLLSRGGGGAIGHRTMSVKDIERKLYPGHETSDVEDAIERLIKKDDLSIHRKPCQELGESSVSINAGKLGDLEHYMKKDPAWYRRIKQVETEMGYAGKTGQKLYRAA